MELNKKLIEYIDKNIMPIYDNFDNGHSRSHVNSVISRSLSLAKYVKEPVDLNIAYTAAAYHDVGMLKGREGHPQHSAEFVLNDNGLKEFFNDSQIKIIAEACADHSTSSLEEPHTIYGKIVCDADKDIDVNVGLMRGWDYSFFHHPERSFEEHVDDIFKEMQRRFGENGLVKFYIGSPIHAAFFNEMKMYSEDKQLLTEKMKTLVKMN